MNCNAHNERAGVPSVSALVERLIGDAQAHAELETLGAHIPNCVYGIT
jgi:hypothetical protein